MRSEERPFLDIEPEVPALYSSDESDTREHHHHHQTLRDEKCTRVQDRLVVILTLLLAVVVATLAGAFMFRAMDSQPSEVSQQHDDCFGQLLRRINETTLTAEEAVEEAKVCITSKGRISSLSVGVMFSWSLYTTIGYGNSFSRTTMGYVISILYISIGVPLFMAFKIEFGQVLSLGILRITKAIIRLRRKCQGIATHHEVPETHPSDHVMAATLLLIIIIYLILTSCLVMWLESMSFVSGLYLLCVTVFLVGLGDVTPSPCLVTFFVLFPIFLCGDTFTSYLNYYIHGRFRIGTHKLAGWVTGRREASLKGEKEIDKEKECVHKFPNITTTSMPMTFLPGTTQPKALTDAVSTMPTDLTQIESVTGKRT